MGVSLFWAKYLSNWFKLFWVSILEFNPTFYVFKFLKANIYFWRRFRFLTKIIIFRWNSFLAKKIINDKISSLHQNFVFWSNLLFLTKFQFLTNISILTKISMFDNDLDFCQNVWSKNHVFHFWPKFQFFIKF